MTNNTSLSVAERFWSKVDIRGEDECWPWTGADDGHGRGQFYMNGRKYRSPRIAWSVSNGVPFPDGLLACHSCDNPPCCNPRHIWPGTMSDNILDASKKGRMAHKRKIVASEVNAAKTHCVHSHEFTLENTYITARGHRNCRKCACRMRSAYEARAALAAMQPAEGEQG